MARPGRTRHRCLWRPIQTCRAGSAKCQARYVEPCCQHRPKAVAASQPVPELVPAAACPASSWCIVPARTGRPIVRTRHFPQSGTGRYGGRHQEALPDYHAGPRIQHRLRVGRRGRDCSGRRRGQGRFPPLPDLRPGTRRTERRIPAVLLPFPRRSAPPRGGIARRGRPEPDAGHEEARRDHGAGTVDREATLVRPPAGEGTSTKQGPRRDLRRIGRTHPGHAA